VALALMAGLFALLGFGSVAALGAGAEGSPVPSLVDCGPGVPLVKCNAFLYSPDPNLTPPPHNAQGPTAAPAETATCGPNFFDTTQLEALTASFGSIACFHFVTSATWIVFGDGMSLTAEVEMATPGGAMIAELNCAADDASCLDPNADHNFGQFSVSYPPHPSSGRSEIQWTEGGRYVLVYDGSCGQFTFDAQTDAWYSSQQDARDALASGLPQPSIDVPMSVSGAEALQHSAPPDTDACEPLAP
jgi:hypothetical protein